MLSRYLLRVGVVVTRRGRIELLDPTALRAGWRQDGRDRASALNSATVRAESPGMSLDAAPGDTAVIARVIGQGTILVNRRGDVKILRSRNRTDDGWNCSDGAGVSDEEAADERRWAKYTPEELAADLQLAAEVNQLRGHRVLGGGLATWDACSGRPCVLPRLAKLTG